MTRGIYVLGGEPATGKSAIALGVQRLLAGQVSRLGVFRPVVAGEGEADPLLAVLQSDGAAVSWGVGYEDVRADERRALAEIVARHHALAASCDAVLVVGTDFAGVGTAGEHAFNARVALNLGLPVLCVVSGHARTAAEIQSAVSVALTMMRRIGTQVVAVIANRVRPADVDAVAAEVSADVPVYVVPEDTLLMAPADVNLIVLHLGNGASATAVERGRSVDTSMGLTPLEGLVMGTRCGDIDPALVFHLRRTAGLELDEIERVLNSGSGMKALAGASDLREIHARTDAGDTAAELALAVYCYRIRKYVGAYLAVLGHVDAVVFTAGVGENDPVVRARALDGLEPLGIRLAEDRNVAVSAEARAISPPGAAVSVLVVPTDEELEMAEQAAALVRRL